MERTIEGPEYTISSDPIAGLDQGDIISFRKLYKVIFKLSREKCFRYKETDDILKIKTLKMYLEELAMLRSSLLSSTI